MKKYDLSEKDNNEFIKQIEKRNEKDSMKINDTVLAIINDVKENKDDALVRYTKKFDSKYFNQDMIKVKDDIIDKAYENMDLKLKGIIRKAIKNITEFHEKQKYESWYLNKSDKSMVGQIIKPLDIVGIYIPGGTAPLISTILMTAIPAKAAKVKRIIMVTPPGKDGNINRNLLGTAKMAGIKEVYCAGGAQAVAAMAFGTQTIPRVDKISGPGNIYVTTAKKQLFGKCGIDMTAGPSELLIIADESANPEYVAADLLSQMEHDILAAGILVTDSDDLIKRVENEIIKQVKALSRKDILGKSLNDFCFLIKTKNISKAVDLSNKVAPEHLELCTREPEKLLGSIKNAGAVFLGKYSSEPVGDYFAGPSHVLPTGGSARFFSPLNVGDFTKKISVISYSKEALENSYEDIAYFAQTEGLDAHANAVKIRFK